MVQKLSELTIVVPWTCSKQLEGLYNMHKNQICTIKQIDANENNMVCIHKLN